MTSKDGNFVRLKSGRTKRNPPGETAIRRELEALRAKCGDPEFIGMYAAFAVPVYHFDHIDRMLQKEELDALRRWSAHIRQISTTEDLGDMLLRVMDALRADKITATAGQVINGYCRRELRELKRSLG